MIIDTIIITEREDEEMFKYKVEMPFRRTHYGLDEYYFKDNDKDSPYIHRYFKTKDEVIDYLENNVMFFDEYEPIEYYCISSECDWGYNDVRCLEVKNISVKEFKQK